MGWAIVQLMLQAMMLAAFCNIVPYLHPASITGEARVLCLQDIVETHLLRDIAARSENFFQAASVVQDLRGVLARTYVQVKTLRQEVKLCTSCSSNLRLGLQQLTQHSLCSFSQAPDGSASEVYHRAMT